MKSNKLFKSILNKISLYITSILFNLYFLRAFKQPAVPNFLFSLININLFFLLFLIH